MALQVNGTFIDQLFTTKIAALTSPRLYIYSGDIPTDIEGFTLTAYASQLLVSYLSGFTLQAASRTLRFATTPNIVNATATGKASWFVLSNSSMNTFFAGTITDQVDGTGVLILESTNLVAGSPVNVIELGVRIF